MLNLIGEPYRMLQVRSLEDTQIAVAQITRSTKQIQKASQIFQISSHQSWKATSSRKIWGAREVIPFSSES